MKIQKISIRNFKSLRSYDTGDLPDGIIGIVGDNGQGKSTLLSAISYALYGPDALATGRADAVTWGEKKTEVVLWFEAEGVEYCLQRSQDTKGTSKASLLPAVNLDNVIASGATTVNAEVERMLGIDLLGFQASVFSKQDDLLGLGSMQASRRVSTMLRLLGIDVIDKAIKYVNEKGKQYKSELEVMRRTVEAMPDLDVDETSRLIDASFEKQQSLESALLVKAEEQKNLLSIRDDLSKRYEDWVAHQSNLSRLRAQVITAEQAISRLKTEVVEPQKPPKPFILIDPAEYSKRTAGYAARAANLRKAKESAVCPTCGRPFEGADQKHLEQEEKELAALLQGIESDAKAAFESDNYNKALESYNTFLIPKYKDAQKRLADATAAKADLEETIGLVESHAPEDITESYNAAVARLTSLNDKARSIVHQVNVIMAERAVYEKELAKYKSIRKTYEDNLKTIKSLEKEVVDYATCSAELANFKTGMVSGVIPTLSERSSALIVQITDGKYSEVALTPQYDIQFRNDQGELKAFPNLSGGEQDAFALAMRLAIADLRASRIGVLVLDEVFESLDADKQESTWQALEKMSSRFNQVFLVTHVAAFKDRAPYTLTM